MNRILTILLLSLLVAGAAGRHKERKHKRHGSWSEWGSKQLARVWPLQALSRTHSAPQTGIAMTASLDGLRYVSHALLPVIEVRSVLQISDLTHERGRPVAAAAAAAAAAGRLLDAAAYRTAVYNLPVTAALTAVITALPHTLYIVHCRVLLALWIFLSRRLTATASWEGCEACGAADQASTRPQ